MKEDLIPVGSLYFLWHPGTEDIFSGYGLTVQPGRKDHLVGLLMVDRPYPVDPAWLTEVAARFGGYQLHAMTRTGERGIACQMRVEPDSLPDVRQSGIAQELLMAMIVKALTPLLQQSPQPQFRVRWNQTVRLWTSEFQE